MMYNYGCLCFCLCSSGKKARILDAEGLALGCEIATSKKKARDLVDSSFHRSVCVLFKKPNRMLMKFDILYGFL